MVYYCCCTTECTLGYPGPEVPWCTGREPPLLWHFWMHLGRVDQRPLCPSAFCLSRRSSLADLLLGCSCNVVQCCSRRSALLAVLSNSVALMSLPCLRTRRVTMSGGLVHTCCNSVSIAPLGLCICPTRTVQVALIMVAMFYDETSRSDHHATFSLTVFPPPA